MQSREKQPYTPLCAGATWLESSLAEKDLGILVDTRLNRNQQCVLAAKKANTGSVPSRLRKGDPSPLFSTGETTAGVLGFPVPDRHGHNGISQ